MSRQFSDLEFMASHNLQEEDVEPAEGIRVLKISHSPFDNFSTFFKHK